MEALNLKDRDTTGVLIALIKFNEESFYCLASVEHWIVQYWNGYVDLSQGNLEEQYFNYLRRFKLNYSELAKAYEKLLPEGDVFDIEGNKPSIYIDFNAKTFKSYFQEQSLEDRMVNGWTGEYGKIEENIPIHLNYWKVQQ